MNRLAAAIASLALCAPTIAFAFGVSVAAVVHDAGTVQNYSVGFGATGAGVAAGVASMSTGDSISSLTLLRWGVDADGNVAWTRAGASLAWVPRYVIDGPDDTVVIAGQTGQTAIFHFLALLDSAGNEIWNRRVPTTASGSVYVLTSDASGITSVEDGSYLDDSHLIRYSLDGNVVWEADLSVIAGCPFFCDQPYRAIAMNEIPERGLVVLSNHESTPSPTITHLLEITTDGALVWEKTLVPVASAQLASARDGRVAVFGRDVETGDLLLDVCDADGTPSWESRIAAPSGVAATTVAFDANGAVYTLATTADALTTRAYSSSGELRWTSEWSPNGSAGRLAGLSVGAPTDPVAVIAPLQQGDAVRGYAADGSVAFDTLIGTAWGTPSSWGRLPDGSLGIVDSRRTQGFDALFAHLDAYGNVLALSSPGTAEVPTSVYNDAVAWQADGGETIFAAGELSFLTRFDAGGAERSRVEFPDAERGTVRALADDTVLAYTDFANSTLTTHVQRRDASGAIAWDSAQSGSYSDLAVHADGATDLMSTDLGNWSLQRRNTAGDPVWSTGLSVAPSQQAGVWYGPQVVPASDGGVYVLGLDDATLAVFVERFDAAGRSVWHRTWPTGTSMLRQRGLVEDRDGIAWLEYDGTDALGTTAHLMRLAADGSVAWAVDFPSEDTSQSGQSLIASRDGGVLLATSAGVHRIGADGTTAWSWLDTCDLGCIPTAIRERGDGHVFLLSQVGVRSDFGYGATAMQVVELDDEGGLQQTFVSHPKTISQDVGYALRVEETTVDIAGATMLDDSLKRVVVLRLNGEDALFADGFDPPARGSNR